jgi:hypothetical protein
MDFVVTVVSSGMHKYIYSALKIWAALFLLQTQVALPRDPIPIRRTLSCVPFSLFPSLERSMAQTLHPAGGPSGVVRKRVIAIWTGQLQQRNNLQIRQRNAGSNSCCTRALE